MNEVKNKKAIIIGAGPAGLTAAYYLLKNTDIKPIIYEADDIVGGISRTINYKGNRIDIGGHRFFSKSDRVMNFWKSFLPVQTEPAKDDILLNRDIENNFSLKSNIKVDPKTTDKTMLVRNRLSRIFFLRKFFSYPVNLSISTLYNLGFLRVFKIGFSYLKVKLFPIKKEKSLQDFFINRFGKELYLTFFKDYTEKVWGVPCDKISPSWGNQRVKGLSISKALIHAIKSIFKKNKSLDQKGTETSLIEKFLYPKFGPGQMWQEVADYVVKNGGNIKFNCQVTGILSQDKNIRQVKVKDLANNSEFIDCADYFFSSMPVKDLIGSFDKIEKQEIKEIANGLCYRDFMTVGLLLDKLKIKNQTKIKTLNNLIPDTWIYIQERDVKIGRLQIFNNWSPYMVSDLNKVWIGLEYFCNEGDLLWNMPDKEFINFAINELVKIGFIDKSDVLDNVLIRMPKTYPAYFGTYDQFDLVRTFVDGFENLFLIGRNGQHRYNNMDHSMLTAMVAVENIINGIKTKDNIWAVNTEDDYHEEKK